MSLPDREESLLDTLQAISDAGYPYVLVGGWAVTAFSQRFSTDVDLVIPEHVAGDYHSLLVGRGYERTRETDTTGYYEGRFIQYSKDVGNPTSIDLLVNALRSRQTDGEWSYQYFDRHSQSARVGRTTSVEARIPERELLVAIKLHSGRLTDARDVVATATDVDWGRVEAHLHRGEPNALDSQLAGILEQLDDERFANAFKGQFEQQTLPEDTIDNVRAFLLEQRDRLK